MAQAVLAVSGCSLLGLEFDHELTSEHSRPSELLPLSSGADSAHAGWFPEGHLSRTQNFQARGSLGSHSVPHTASWHPFLRPPETAGSHVFGQIATASQPVQIPLVVFLVLPIFRVELLLQMNPNLLSLKPFTSFLALVGPSSIELIHCDSLDRCPGSGELLSSEKSWEVELAFCMKKACCHHRRHRCCRRHHQIRKKCWETEPGKFLFYK